MPLIKSGSKQAISQNIREMIKAGHPQKQAVAAALSTARKYKYADGGEVPWPVYKPGKDRATNPISGQTDFTVPDFSRYPNYSDLDKAREVDLSYGSPHAGFFRPGAKMDSLTAREAMDQGNDPQGVEYTGRPTAITQRHADNLERAWLATQRSPITALGFDPHRTSFTPKSEPRLTVAGQYNPATDMTPDDKKPVRNSIWYHEMRPAALVHESLHRGLEKLRQAGVRVPTGMSDEMLTRALMHRHFGDVEMGYGDAGDKEVVRGRNYYPKKVLDDFEKEAANMIARERPRGPRATGGRAYATGGYTQGSPWEERAAARSITHAGMLKSNVPGRTDKLPITVGGGAYVLPADHLAALGQGNSQAGAAILNGMFGLGGNKKGSVVKAMRPTVPKMKMKKIATGGDAGEPENPVDIVAAGGEWVVPPKIVRAIGGGDHDKGCKILDKWVLSTRKQHIKTLKDLKPPKK